MSKIRFERYERKKFQQFADKFIQPWIIGIGANYRSAATNHVFLSRTNAKPIKKLVGWKILAILRVEFRHNSLQKKMWIAS